MKQLLSLTVCYFGGSQLGSIEATKVTGLAYRFPFALMFTMTQTVLKRS